jgi:hypothetical protein
MEKNYYDYSQCKLCQGKRCTTCAGSYIPSDFKEPITSAFILSLLHDGKYAIDWWDGDATGTGKLSVTRYIRPRHVGESAIKGSWGGVCVNWSKEKGCSLTEADRPHQCKKLIPNKDHTLCTTLPKDKATKQECAIAWYSHQYAIETAIEDYFNEN